VNERTRERVPIAIAMCAALVRLLPLHYLHPLNWDELEFFTATKWIGQGLVPFRDFWEHHSPLMWFVFAPITRLTDSPGVEAIIALRWAQIPVWIATYWLIAMWMRDAGISRFSRWIAIAIALCSSLFMIPAVEYRVESMGCLFVALGLVLAQRSRWFFAGAAFCLAGFSNLRLGPILVVAVLWFLATRRLRSWPMIAGGFAALAACLSYFVFTGALGDLWKQVWVENLAEKYATPVAGGFIHRLLVPFGVRLLATDRLFEFAAIDVGGILVLLVGFAGIILALRRGGDLRTIAILQIVNLAFVAFMKFIYNYHFALVVVLMVPLIAAVLETTRHRELFVVMLGVAFAVNVFAAVFRGKELDLAYQDRIMREVHARARPGDKVWSGIPWAIRREPAFRFWFLPELARILVRNHEYPGFDPRSAPAAIVFDYNLLRWCATVQRDVGPNIVRNYVPLWRELWIPGMNARLEPRQSFTWEAPREGAYRVYVSSGLAGHPWFGSPFFAASYKRDDAARLTFRLPEAGAGDVRIDADLAHVKRGQRITATNPTNVPLAIFLLPTDDRVLFRQPPPGATLEAETTRVTHMPQPGLRLQP